MRASSKKYDLDNERYVFSDNVREMPKSALSQLIDKALASGLSFRKIRSQSGGKVSLGQLNTWHKSTQKVNMTLESVIALAKGLGESPTVVFEAAVGRSTTAIKDESLKQLFEEIGNLSSRNREEVEILLECLQDQVRKRLTRQT